MFWTQCDLQEQNRLKIFGEIEKRKKSRKNSSFCVKSDLVCGGARLHFTSKRLVRPSFFIKRGHLSNIRVKSEGVVATGMTHLHLSYRAVSLWTRFFPFFSDAETHSKVGEAWDDHDRNLRGAGKHSPKAHQRRRLEGGLSLPHGLLEEPLRCTLHAQRGRPHSARVWRRDENRFWYSY